MLGYKAKGCFLSTASGKYFDFSVCYSSWVLGYGNSNVQAKAKRFLPKAFPKEKFNSAILKNQLASLFHAAPFLHDYHAFMVTPQGIDALFSAWHQNTSNDFFYHKEACCTLPYYISNQHFATHQPSANTESKNKVPLHVQTDAHFFFNGNLKNLLPNAVSVLYLNAFYPLIFYDGVYAQKKQLEHFQTLIVGGLHPYGLDAYKLLFIRKDSLTNFFTWGLDEKALNYYTGLCRFSVAMYQWGLAYTKMHLPKIRLLRPRFTHTIEEEANYLCKKQWLHSTNPYSGEGFHYKLHWTKSAIEAQNSSKSVDARMPQGAFHSQQRFFFP